MTTGIATATANAILDSLCRSVNWTDPTAFYIKLHIGDPGTGSSNAAAATTRKAVTFSAASGGAITNSVAVTWTGIGELPSNETISHVSFWDAAAAGNFLGSDALEVARAVVAAGTFTIAIGDIDLSIPVAA